MNIENETILDVNKIVEMKEELGSSFANILGNFRAGLRLRPESIRQALEEKNSKRMSMESHSLKSTCRQLGLLRMGKVAEYLEQISDTGNLTGAEEMVQRLFDEMELANKELDKNLLIVHKPKPFFDKAT
ncbi:MAG: Hpt domain-containing protein [Magnetococcus sp. DMHC-6]